MPSSADPFAQPPREGDGKAWAGSGTRQRHTAVEVGEHAENVRVPSSDFSGRALPGSAKGFWAALAGHRLCPLYAHPFSATRPFCCHLAHHNAAGCGQLWAISNVIVAHACDAPTVDVDVV